MKKTAVNMLILAMTVLLALSAVSCSGNKAGGQEQTPADEQEEEQEEEKMPGDEPGTEEEAPEVKAEDMLDSITVNTQSSIRIEGPKTIYVDPYKRAEAPHDADIVLITHAHYDHFDEPSLRNVVNNDTLIVCPDSMRGSVEALGLGKDLLTMGTGSWEEAGDVTIEAVPAYNLNKNFHPKSNGWLGYVITMDGVRYYAAGDTDALPELGDVECDIAFVPIGGTYTMTAKEAAGLVNSIAPEIAIPIHYGTIVGKAADAETFRSALDSGIKTVMKVEDAK